MQTEQIRIDLPLIDLKKIKHSFRNGIVDGASVVIVLGITFTAIQGLTILYTSYYNTSALPTPADFQSAGYQFTSAISLHAKTNATAPQRKTR